jgi:glyoxylase-like metal-dependent hydrolase (beta-lactamase superfamily II)
MTLIRTHLLAAASALTLLTSAAHAQKQAPTPKPLPAGIAPFETAKISATSWYGRFGWTNCAWIDLGSGVLVVDTGGTAADAANLLKQIQETTKGKPIKWIVLTHLHGDSNNGLKAFLPTDATIFVNARAAGIASALQPSDAKVKAPTIVGVTNRSLIVAGGQVVELGTPPAGAHSDADLFAYHRDTGTAYVGDLVNPGSCPMMSDPHDEPSGWLSALDRLQGFRPGLLVPTRGNSSTQVQSEIAATRSYVERVLGLIVDMKKRGIPEARVAAELQTKKLGDYCPVQLDSINTVSLFRRATPDGAIPPPAPPIAAPEKKRG